MVTKFDKALTALIVPLVLYFINWLARNYGLEVAPEVQAALGDDPAFAVRVERMLERAIGAARVE